MANAHRKTRRHQGLVGFKVMKINMAAEKWLQACEEVKLELEGQNFASMRTYWLMSGSWHGRRRTMSCLIKLLLTKSLMMAVMTRVRHHHIPFLEKLKLAKNRRNK